MVAVIAGNGLGLGNTSLDQLGQAAGGQAGVGGAGTDQYLNIANGNLVLRDPGQSLVFDGTSLEMLRTYNSQGQLLGDNGWLFGFGRNIGAPTGTPNTEGSTVTRTGDDGSSVVYVYDSASGAYINQGQSGTVDELRWDAASSTWRWTDGASRVVETYDAAGRLASVANPQTGASFTFTWQGGHLVEIQAGDGDRLTLGYDANGHLTGLTVSEVPPNGTDAVVRQQASYVYDALGRLISVSTTLASDTAANSGTFTTTYTYDGGSDRIASVTEGDGTTVAYQYTQDESGNYRVSRIVTGTGSDAQALDIVYADGTTTVTDSLGNAWSYGFSSDGHLISVNAPPVNGEAAETSYTYDSAGNLIRSVGASGGVTHYAYDAHGNLLSVEGPSGETTSYTYNADNQMLTRTVYAVAARGEAGTPEYVAPSGAQTTHFVYDDADRLVYVIDPLGSVTRRDYTTDVAGNTVVSSTFAWRNVSFATQGNEPSAADLAAWESQASVQAFLADASRVDFSYDARGQLASQTAYDVLDAAGHGVMGAGTAMTRTTYDAAGRLLQTATVRGQDRDIVESTTYAYDGLGRLVSSTDALGHATSYVYLDQDHTIEIIDASGLITTRVYNSAGLLISSTQSTGAPPHAGDTFYDAAGRPVVTVDADGLATYTFYDAEGRTIGTVDTSGKLVARTFDDEGNLLSTVHYATPIDTSSWLAATGPTAAIPAAPPIPEASNQDTVSLNVYDDQGRLVASIADDGTLVVITRDAAGHATATRRYAAVLSATQVRALGLAPGIEDVLSAASKSANDTLSLAVYDENGLLLASVDDTRSVTVFVYDAAGRVTSSSRYAPPLAASVVNGLGDKPTLSAVMAAIPGTATVMPSVWIRGQDGSLQATVDQDGRVTLYTYADGVLSATTTLDQTLDKNQILAVLASPKYGNLIDVAGVDPQNIGDDGTITIYDAEGRVAAVATNSRITLTTYDVSGHIATTAVYYTNSSVIADLARDPTLNHVLDVLDGSSQSSSVLNIYDPSGNLVGNLQGNVLTYTTAASDGSWKLTSLYYLSGDETSSLQGGAPWAAVQAIVQGRNANSVSSIDYYDQQGKQIAHLGGAQGFAEIYDDAGNLTASMSGGGPAPVGLLQGGVPLPYDEVVSGKLDVFLHYEFFDENGNKVATVDATQQWGGDGYYGLYPDITYWTTDPDRHISTASLRQAAMHEDEFSAFARHPTLAAIEDTTISMYARIKNATYANEAGQVSAVLDVDHSSLALFTYDSQGRVIEKQNFYVSAYYYGIAGDLPSVADILNNPEYPSGEVSSPDFNFYADDATGTTAYMVDAQGVRIERRGLDGNVVSTASYAGSLSDQAFSTLRDSPSLSTLQSLISQDGLKIAEVRLGSDDQAALPRYEDGFFLFVSKDTQGVLIVSNAYIDPGEPAVLAFAETGDASAILSQIGTKGGAYINSVQLTDSQGRMIASVSSGGASFWTYGSSGIATSYTSYGIDMDAVNALGSSPSIDDLRYIAGYNSVSLSIYDDLGHQVATISQYGEVKTYHYDAAGHLLSTLNHSVNLTSQQVSELARSPSMSTLEGDLAIAGGARVDQSIHDANGKVVATIDADGNVKGFEYDDQGRLLRVTAYAASLEPGFGLITSLDVLRAELRPSADDQVSITIYDGLGHAAATIDPAGVLTVTTYDAGGQAVRTVRYAQALTRQQIASLGGNPPLAQVLRIVDGRTAHTAYNQAGQATATVDQHGVPTFFFYDARGRVSATVAGDGALTTYVYDEAGAVVSSTAYANRIDITAWFDPMSGTLSAPAGAPVAVAGDGDRTTLTLRDASGRMVAEVDPSGIVTRMAYDGEGRLVATTVSALRLSESALDALVATPSLSALDAEAPPSAADRTTRTVYDAAGRPAYSIDAAGYVVERSYDGQGNIVSVRRLAQPLDESALATLGLSTVAGDMGALLNPGDGDLVTLNFYDAAGRTVGSVDEEGFLITWVYDEQSHTQVSTRHAVAFSPAQRSALTGRESAQDLIAMLPTDAGARSERDTFDALGELVDHMDATGAETVYGYDAAGHQTSWSTQDASGHFSGTTSYDAFGELISSGNGVGDVSTSVWNEFGRLVSTTDGAGNTTWYVYDREGRLAYQIAGRPSGDGTVNGVGAITAYSYDAFGDMVGKRTYATMVALTKAYEGDALNPEGVTAEAMGEWLTSHRVAAASDESTQYSYTKSGQIASATDGEGYVTLYAYDAFGEQVSVTRQVSGHGGPLDSSNSVVTEYAYDARGERTQVTEASGTALQRSTVTAYDAFGRATSITEPSGHVTSFEFDRLGRQIAVSQSIGGALSRTAVMYDAFDRVVSQTDAMGHVTTFGYDPTGRAMTVTTPEGVSMTTVRDVLGDVVSITDAAGNVTTYAYDEAGRLVETRDAAGAVDTVTYASGGTVAHFAGTHGESIVTYDGSGRVLSRVVDPQGDNLVTSYTYDGAGRLVSQSDPLGQATFTYDADGRLTQSIRWSEGSYELGNLGSTQEEDASFAYDGLGHVTLSIAGYGADAEVTRFAFDALGRRTAQVVDPDGLALTSRFEYDADDNVVRSIDPLGVASTAVYDEAGRLVYSTTPSGLAGSGKAILTHNTYDKDGNLVASVTYATAVDGGVFDDAAGKSPAALLATADALVPASSAGDISAYIVRDNDGRARFAVDAEGIVTETRYNASGQVAETLVYATAFSPDAALTTVLRAGAATPADLSAALANQGVTSEHARVEYDYYDDAGRLAFVVRAVEVDGQVEYQATGTTYATDGQVLTTTVFTRPLSATSLPQATTQSISAALAGQLVDGSVRTTTFVYDAARKHIATIGPDGSQSFLMYWGGKVSTVIDGGGGTTFYGYDFAGRVVYERHLSSQTDTSGWLDDGIPTDMFGQGVASQQESDSLTETSYDTAGRLQLVNRAIASQSEWGASWGGTTYAYDAAGRLASKTDTSHLTDEFGSAEGIGEGDDQRTTRYFYDAAGHTIGTLDASGVLTFNSVDAAGHVTAVLTYATPVAASARLLDNLQDLTPPPSADDQTTTYFLDDLGRAIGAIDPAGYLTTFTLDLAGRVTSTSRYGTVVPPSSRAQLSTAVSAVSGAPVRTTSSSYDARGRLVAEVNAEGTETSYRYDLDGNVLEKVVAAGTPDERTTSYEYDLLGQLTAQTDAAGVRTVFTYGANGKVATATDAMGNTTWSVYDGAGNLTYTIRGLAAPDGTPNVKGEVVETRHDGRGLLAYRTAYAITIDLQGSFSPSLAGMDAIANAIYGASAESDYNESFEYDGMGNQTFYSGSTTQTATYDGFGELVYSTNGHRDAYGNYGSLDTTYEYDATGHVTRKHDMTPVNSSGFVYVSGGYGAPIDAVQTWTYDAFGRAVDYVDANGAVSNYRYDALGDKIDESRMVDGVLRETVQEYDAFGRLTLRTDALGLTTTFVYDDAARTVVTTFPDGLSATSMHNREGQQVSIVDTSGLTTTYTYDLDGRLTDVSQPDGNHVSSQYDALGNLVLSTDAAGVATAYTYDAAGRVLTQTVDPAGLHLTTIHEYSGAGLEVRMVDAAGVVSTYRHDASGHVAEMKLMNAGAPAGAAPELDVTYWYDIAGYSTGENITSAGGETKYVSETRDPFGRLLHSLADGVERRWAYDANGNLRMSSDGMVNTYYAYNDAGQLVWKATAAMQPGYDVFNAVTGYTYDADGNLLSTTQYATPRNDGDLTTFRNGIQIDWDTYQALSADEAAAQLAEASSSNDRSSYRVYDDLGRLAYEIDAQGLVRETRYDALGRAVAAITYDRPVSVDETLAGALASGGADAATIASALAAAGNGGEGSRVTRSFYDEFGRVSFTTSEADVAGSRIGVVTELHYDADGRVTFRLTHDATLSGAQLAAATTASLSAWAAGDTLGVGSHTVYDAVGRPVFVVDASGMVQQTSYDGDGRAISSYTYANPISPTSWTPGGVAAAVAVANPSAADVRGTNTTYDARGNVLSVTTLGSNRPSETYTYDALGKKTSFTDRDGNTWTYAYDYYGQLISETSPPVEVVDTSRNPPSTVTGPVVTSYRYDYAGRVTETVTSSPTGTFTWTDTAYDPAGHVILESSRGGSASNDGYVSYNGSIDVQSRYDIFGQLVSTIDPNGNANYKVYDHAGRLAYDIDAEGYVSGYAYDAFGNVTETTRYSQPLDLSSIIGWDIGEAPTLDTVQENLVASAADRSVHTEYDGFGRKVSVTQAAVDYVHPDGTPGVGVPTTRFTYDVRGRVTSTSTLVDGNAGDPGAVWATTYTWYDAEGRQTMSVDPMGYVTTWTYNGFGDVTGQTEYGTPVSTSGIQPDGPKPAVVANPALDRVTTTAYDQEGRKASESVLRTYTDASGNVVRGYVTTTYGYDGENRVTSATQDGRTILTSYDSLGRIHSVTAPAERVLVANWKEQLQAHPDWDLTTDALYVTGAQVVTYGYDASGNKTVETQSSTAGGPTRSTWYLYDESGRLMGSSSPAPGAPNWGGSGSTFYTYDQGWNVVSSVTWLSHEGGLGGLVQVESSFTYDALGRQTSSSVMRSGADHPDTATSTRYDGFGEVVASGLGDKSVSTYDRAGRKITSIDPETGIEHSYVYDLAGNLIQDTYHVTGGALVYTRYTRDLDGRVLSQQAPSTTSSTGEGTPQHATYDRWGNVLTSTDALGNVTTYTYNERNQLVSTIGPQVTAVDAAGNASVTTPTKTTSYNADGAVVAVTDENGNVVRTVYDAAGQVVDVVDAAGAHTRVAYDGLGNEVAGQTGVRNGSEDSLHITFKEVDGQGRTIDEGDFFNDGTGYKATLRQVYVLDEAGNRVVVFDGLGSAALQANDQTTAARHATYYSYDSQGRVIASQTGAQRDFSQIDPSQYPAPIQQPRNMDFEQGNVAWTSGQPNTWTISNGTAVYVGNTDDSIRFTNDDGVPVTPGQVINAWADLWSTGNHGGSAVNIEWYRADGSYIGGVGGNIQTTDDGRGMSTVRGVAPSGAAFARISVGASNSSNAGNKTTCYGVGWDYAPPDVGLSPILDGSIFVSLPSTTFSMQPLNPDFENGASGWEMAPGWDIHQADNTANGKWIATYTGSTVGTLVNKNRAPVLPGQKITAHAQITLDQRDGGEPAAALLILWYDKDGNLIRYNSSNVITDGNSGHFQDVSVTDVAPPGAAYATIGLSGNGNGAGFAVFDAISWDYRYVPSLNPGATLNTFTYDIDGNLVAQTNADGDSESWVRDTYGRVIDHTDLSGATYHYTYDAYSGAQLTETDNWGAVELGDVTAPGYVHGANGTSNSETRTYNAAGQVTSVTYGDGSTYSYAYDANGNQVRQEASTVDGNGQAVHTVTTTTYDSHGRISQVTSDDGSEVLAETYTYDAAGNRRSIVATVTAGGIVKASTTSWYDYDANNRVTVSDGDLVNGAITIGSRSTSYGMSYDAAGNLASRTTRSGGTLMSQRNYYDARGQLVRADYASALGDPNAWRGMAETRTYDNNGNVVSDDQYYMLGSTANQRYNPKLDPDSPDYIGGGAGTTPGANIGGMLSTATITRYDTYGRVDAEQTFGHDQYWDGTGGDTTPDALPAENATTWSGMALQSAVLYQGPGGSSAYDAMGNVVFYQYRVNSTRLDQYTVTYLKKEGYLESSTSGQNITNLVNVRPATDESYYNVRGERIAIAQHTQYAYGTVADTVRAFAYDGNGQIISRRDGTANGDTIDQGSDPTLKNQHYVYVNGQQVAHYDEKNTLDVLSQVTAFSSGTGAGDYVVQEGDTLKSIAQAVYGNASLWYVVAQANALTGDADLAAGLSLSIPSVTTTKNDATTFKPYNPSEIQGSTTPDLPVIAPPPPPPKHHCNVIAAVVVIAVVVVASIVTFGAAASLGSVAAAAIAGAAGSAAGQLAGDALGTHQGFSLGEVFTSAATAAATAGAGYLLSGGSSAAAAAQAGTEAGQGASAVAESTSWSVFGTRAAEAAAGYVVQDGTAKLVGEPAHFSWAGLVSNSLAAGVSSFVGPSQQQVQAGEATGPAWRAGAASLVQGVVQRGTSVALGDDNVPSWESIGTNAVATAAGTYIGNKLSPGPSAQANLAAWNRQGGGLSAYGALDAGGNGYSLVEGTASSAGGYAYLDNGNALRSYGLNYYAGTRAIDAAIGSDALTTTPQGNVRVEDVQWSGSDGSLGYGGIGFPMRPVAIPYTAEPIPTLSSANVTANPAGVIDEHYDPVWARQQAALAAQASEMDAANQQRLSDFFNDQALHIVGAPIYALSGAAKEAVNGAKSLGHTLWAGGEFQAAKYAAFGAAARGDLRGIDAADRLGAHALADASTPVAPVFQVSAFEHAAAFGVAPFNPEEAAVAGMSFVERVASGLRGSADLATGINGARSGGYAEGMLLAQGGVDVAEGALTSTTASSVDRLGVTTNAGRESVPVTEAQLEQLANAESGLAAAYGDSPTIRWSETSPGAVDESRRIVPNTTGPQVVEGAGSSLDIQGHKIYDRAFSPLSTNPGAQYRFSDPTYRSTGGDVYFGENLATSYYEVRQDITGKSLFVGDVRVDNILDLTDENVLNQMKIDSSRLQARADSPIDQKAIYGYTNQIANQAFDAGYSGILYPSTRGPGNAVVLFGGRYNPNLITPIVDFPLQ
ncbi:RES domain-containing protein [Luteibacter jiangsuensis]